MRGEVTNEVFLYKVEAVLSENKLMTIIVVAGSDEKAFTSAENNLVRHTISSPNIQQLSIVEKKPLSRGGVGYVIETLSFD
ncbi:hypothetical protein BEP19_16140 [Ammoniphilus oxalaticus]|uniref:DUF3906 domain-containing protein n=1 Tax=Ammoniphilus oxalaticus TaxID=66863 RepID=A0A419SQL5_9BACL|nr:DUF3906 family protein [Ammoniphilus oxalaticus]RKD26731.1 hypothetical protein BEP19_16140 [Ammoniphilus oxalaticus]